MQISLVALLYSKGHASLSAKFIFLKLYDFFEKVYPMVTVGEWLTLHKSRGSVDGISQLSVNSVFIS